MKYMIRPRTVYILLFCMWQIPVYSQMSGGQIRRSSRNVSASSSTKKGTSLNKVSEPMGYANGHGYVDLGLPSGTLWATCNVGASKPEEYGDYFAWGETSGYRNGKTSFDWKNYSWCRGAYNTLTKYNRFSDYGMVDNQTELVSEDDAAYVNWGTLWCLPSSEQLRELVNSEYVNKTWIPVNGVYGLKIRSKVNGNSLFLPAAGVVETSIRDANSFCMYWSRTLYTGGPRCACLLYQDSKRMNVYEDDRCNGRSVRAVTQ
mgnify:CR=1 FL=1